MKIYLCILVAAILTPFFNPASAQKNKDTPPPTHTIPWAPIRDADILWKKRVWREIQVYERNNAPMRSNQQNALAGILLNGIRSGAIKAYADGDTAFTTPLNPATLDAITQCDATSLSRNTRYFLNYHSKHPTDSTIYDTSFISSCTYPQQVEFFEIKEDWLFDRNQGLMLVHINAIAPAAYVHGEKKPLFWLHYPDIRKYIDSFEVFNGDKKLNLSWDEYFESRQFSSRITYVQGGMGRENEPKHSKRKKRKKNDGDDSINSHDIKGVDSTTEHDMWVY